MLKESVKEKGAFLFERDKWNSCVEKYFASTYPLDDLLLIIKIQAILKKHKLGCYEEISQIIFSDELGISIKRFKNILDMIENLCLEGKEVCEYLVEQL